MQNDSTFPTQRQHWMETLAKASWVDLEPLWQSVPKKPVCKVLRKPETGLIMVRARMGGSGQPFNSGEATATRCTVVSASGMKGHAYILGRNKDHALVAAKLDAALQDDVGRDGLIEHVIAPLRDIQRAKFEQDRRKVAATKVDFFTLVRGEDD